MNSLGKGILIIITVLALLFAVQPTYVWLLDEDKNLHVVDDIIEQDDTTGYAHVVYSAEDDNSASIEMYEAHIPYNVLVYKDNTYYIDMNKLESLDDSTATVTLVQHALKQ